MSTYEPEVSEWVKDLKERQERLAEALLDIAYCEGCWAEPTCDPELKENYLKDAWDILMSSPHLLPLEAVENLKALGLLKLEKEEE